MTIIPITNPKQLPPVIMWSYAIGKYFTEADALDAYQAKYGVEADKAYRCGAYLYVPIPEGERK